ncbi:MAG: hypothetical protein R3C61_00875 [Bacteroidia bacterium]
MKPFAKHTRLKGSTLTEVLVALSVLSVAFGAGLLSLRQITGIHSALEIFRTQTLTRQELYFFDGFSPVTEEKIIAGRRIVRTIRIVSVQPPLVEITVDCYFRNQLLETRSIITALRPHNYENDNKTKNSRIYPAGDDGRDDTDRTGRNVWSSGVQGF